MKNRIIFFSGGIASFAVAEFVKRNHPEDNIILYFTDTLWENQDTYRFINECADKLELPLLIHHSDMNPIQLMFEKKLIYNSMIGDCSKLLKQKVARDFIKNGIRPAYEKWRNACFLKEPNFTDQAILYLGIGFEEMHREKAIIKNWSPFNVELPLIYNNIYRDQALLKYNIAPPEMYQYGFSHNNCNARCVKAGQGHHKLFRENLPLEFNKFKEQEYHLMICVSSYRYITDDTVPENEKIPEYVRPQLLKELDDAYRDYFYDRADQPKRYIHPSATSSNMKFQLYSFMKRKSKHQEKVVIENEDGSKGTKWITPSVPFMLRELDREMRQNKQMDIFDFGGCGCFVEDISVDPKIES